MKLAYVVVASCLACGIAHAEGEEPATTGFINKVVYRLEIDDCTPDKDVANDELLKRGAEYYQRGEVLYLQGDYPGAVSELVRSYCEVPFFQLLKDIGQAYERELEYGKAIAYFERYILAVPADAKRRDQCSPDPQEEKRNVEARIKVLEKLPAKIRVQTTPADADVRLELGHKPFAFGHSGDELLVPGGQYDLIIERAGYKPKSRTIMADIGKPYTYDEQLEPIKGRLKIQVIPGDARLFLDKRQVGSGIYETELPGGRYLVQAEAQDRQTFSREIEVLPDKDTSLSIELPGVPEYGRKQLLVYGGIGGLVSAALLANVQGGSATYGLAALGGAGAGLFAVYYGTPKNLALGTSSLTVSSSLIGGVGGGALAAALDRFDTYGAPLVGGGLLIGAVAGYYVADRTHPSPGDAAVINSGALWGTVAGGLFTASFDPGAQIGAGLVLSGLGMGTMGGVLLQRYFTVSRGRAALIDASGVVGIVLALATENIVNQAQGVTNPTQERTSNYMLGGLAAGLVLGGLLTRTMDEPKLAVTPTFSKATGANGTSTTTIGIGGAF